MRKLKINEQKLLEAMKGLVNEANECYSDYDEDEEAYNQVVTVTNTSNLFCFVNDFDELYDSMDAKTANILANILDKTFKGIVEVVDTDLE